MTTANSMCMVAEALGMTLPGNSSMSAVSSQIRLLSYQAGKQIMNLVKENITARKIMTVDAIKNAIKLDMAVAASSNLILHIPAIAHEAGYDLPWWKYFDEASNEIPLLSHLAPGGPNSIKEFDLAGGMRAMLKELLPRLNGDCLTVTGHTLRENVEDAENYNHDVIRSLDNPVMTEPGIGVLYGNLAPEGAIIKIAAVPHGLWPVSYTHLDVYKRQILYDRIQVSSSSIDIRTKIDCNSYIGTKRRERSNYNAKMIRLKKGAVKCMNIF